jgi:hypothetical protein
MERRGQWCSLQRPLGCLASVRQRTLDLQKAAVIRGLLFVEVMGILFRLAGSNKP